MGIKAVSTVEFQAYTFLLINLGCVITCIRITYLRSSPMYRSILQYYIT